MSSPGLGGRLEGQGFPGARRGKGPSYSHQPLPPLRRGQTGRRVAKARAGRGSAGGRVLFTLLTVMFCHLKPFLS